MRVCVHICVRACEFVCVCVCYGMIDFFTLSQRTQVIRESLSAQTKLDTSMCPEGKQGTDKNCGTTGQRGMVLVRVIREHPRPQLTCSWRLGEITHLTPCGLNKLDWMHNSED